MSENGMPTVGDVIAGKYEITDLIGEGGMGSVYKAHHKLTGKKVAMKWMLPELAENEDAVQRFLREAQAAGRIDHKNVVDIYDVGQEDGAYFLVMEYLIGEPLTDALERGGMSVADVIDCMIPAMRGVAAAHSKGVVHRDLKPDNIFLCRSEDGGWRAACVSMCALPKTCVCHHPRLGCWSSSRRSGGQPFGASCVSNLWPLPVADDIGTLIGVDLARKKGPLECLKAGCPKSAMSSLASTRLPI